MSKIADLFRIQPEGKVRLGIGDVVDAGGELATWRGRNAFIQAFQEHAPEAYEELWSADLERKYRRWERRLLEQIDEGIEEGLSWEIAFTDPEMSPFTIAVDSWAIAWNVRTDWMHRIVTAFFLDTYLPDKEDMPWSESDSGVSPFVLIENVGPLIRAPGPRLLFAGKEYPEGDGTYWPMDVFPEDPETGDRYGLDFDWNPAVEGRKANEDRAVAQFLHWYRAAQDARLKEAEERYPNKAGTRRYEHFVWLVQYQVLTWTYADVAQKAFKSRQTVSDAIQATAALIGLPLREPDPPGRKPKSV